jgi:outer membrane autotransporter protein
MKNNLLLTTALVALAMPAWADSVAYTSEHPISSNEEKVYNIVNSNTRNAEDKININAPVGVMWVKRGATATVLAGSNFENNKAESGVFYVSKPEGTVEAGLVIAGTAENKVTFKGNSAYFDGGAIASMGRLSIEHAIFEGNKTENTTTLVDKKNIGGGAIALGSESDSSILSITSTLFKNNSSQYDGGAIATRKAKDGNNVAAKLDIEAEFTGNSASNNGGAIYNTFYSNNGTNKGNGVTVKGNFKENTAGVSGGAIYNDGTITNGNSNGGVMTVLAGSKFVGNEANEDGGAIYNSGVMTVGDNIEFSENKAGWGGAIFTKWKMNIGDDVIFENNEATVSGGALYVSKYSSTEDGSLVIGDNVLFDSNKAQYDGGAITNMKNMLKVGEGAKFTNNKSLAKDTNNPIGGGAIALGSESQTKLDGALFENNSSAFNGGAIATRLADDTNGSKHNQINAKLDITAQFIGNTAGADGGAIYNTFYTSSEGNGVKIADSTFTNNKAEGKGGAIFNDGIVDTNGRGGTINFSGKNVFAGNTAGGKANDIHNSGTINVSGDLTLDGGVSGEGSIVFASGTNLTVQANKTTITNKVTNNGATLNMIFDTGFEGQYDLITETGSLDTEFTIADNTIYNIASVENGLYEITKKSSSEVAETLGASSSEASALLAATSGSSNNQYFNDVADALNTAAQNGDASAVKEATKLGADANPIVSTQETGTHDVLFGVVSSELNGDSGAMAGMSSGDVFKKASAWIRGLFNKADHESTSKSSGFNADTYGVAMGIDKEINSDTRLGFGYANSQTDIESTGRDTDVDTNSFFVYSQYKPANWYVNTMLAYSWSEYDETKSVMGANAGAKYDVDTIALQSMYGYETKFKSYDLTPEFGFRYLHINQDAYTDKLGTTVAENSEDVLTLVAGAKVAKNYTLENGTVLRPELKAAVTYDLFDADNSANVALANGASYVVEGEKLNRLGFEFGAKVTTNATDKVEVSAGYLTRVREDYQDHTVTFDARYNF